MIHLWRETTAPHRKGGVFGTTAAHLVDNAVDGQGRVRHDGQDHGGRESENQPYMKGFFFLLDSQRVFHPAPIATVLGDTHISNQVLCHHFEEPTPLDVTMGGVVYW